MKLYPHNLLADAKEERRQGERAFTMVEIAIAIGVIGFALVAVIGILPAGMSVQKDNREDTTISQDAPFFLDAIRNGANVTNQFAVNQGLDFLTNYVERISIVGFTNGVSSTDPNQIFTNFPGAGAEIVGLLSTPNGFRQNPEGVTVGPNNFTVTRAIVRSLSGAAVQQNGANQITAFRYQMDVQVVPFVNVAPDSTNVDYYVKHNYPTNGPEVLSRYYRYLELNPNPNPAVLPFLLPQQTITNLAYGLGSLAFNCFEVKVRFSWPAIVTGNGAYTIGPNHQTYRTVISSTITAGARLKDNAQLWFFQPQSFTNQENWLAL